MFQSRSGRWYGGGVHTDKKLSVNVQCLEAFVGRNFELRSDALTIILNPAIMVIYLPRELQAIYEWVQA